MAIVDPHRGLPGDVSTPSPTGEPRRSLWSSAAPVAMALGLDLALTSLSLLLATVLRARLPFFNEAGDVDDAVALVGFPIVVGWLVVIALSGGYAVNITGAGAMEFKRVVRASLFAGGLVGVGCYLAKFPLSRGFFFLLFGIGIPLLFAGRYALRLLVHRLRAGGRLRHRVLLVGSPAQVDEIGRILQRERWLGFELVGAAVPAAERVVETARGIPVLGLASDTAVLVDEVAADILLFAGGGLGSAEQMRRAAWELEESPVQIMLVPSLTDVASDRIRVRPAAGLPFIQVDGPRAHRAAHALKRSFDIAGSALLLLAFSPVLLVTAAAVKLHDRGPVLFRQERVGRSGDIFRCLKFRSMVVDAEARLAALQEQNKHAGDGVLFKLADDPRVTSPGKVIRRFSLDELPQLVNVLRGDMSLVGPRPPLPSEVAGYDSDVKRRLAVRPGMTGLWQVSGRSDLSWEESVRLDLYYVDNWSMLQDLVILARTARAVFSRRGAY